MQTVSKRLEAIRDELSRAADEYVAAREQFESTRVRFETARERFASIRHLAQGMMTTHDWISWSVEKPEVEYVGMGIGDAITEYLRTEAFMEAGEQSASGAPPFNPCRSLEQIADALEAGGFGFKTTATGREVNAALINLAGVTKCGDGKYAIAEADEILAFCLSTGGGEE